MNKVSYNIMTILLLSQVHTGTLLMSPTHVTTMVPGTRTGNLVATGTLVRLGRTPNSGRY